MSIIIGSFKKDKIIELVANRRVMNHSISEYDVENRGLFSIRRGYGELNYETIESDPSFYKIVFLQFELSKHIQPTTSYDIYPSESYYHNFSEHVLWFKGKLNQREIEKLQFEEETKEDWEPDLLLKHVVRYEAPVDVDGSFSCVYCNGKDLFVFRNELETMFFDLDMTMCTEKHSDDFFPTTPNKVLKIDFKRNSLFWEDEFQTVKRWYPEDK